MKRLIAAAAAATLAGCGTIVRGTEEDVAIQVTPADASVTTDIGMSCTGSCTLNVPRKQSFTVTAAREGYAPMSVPVLTRVTGGGVAGMAGNALFGGIVGVGVDAVSGATLDHYPNPVIISLRPLDPGAPITPRPAEPLVAMAEPPPAAIVPPPAPAKPPPKKYGYPIDR